MQCVKNGTHLQEKNHLMNLSWKWKEKRMANLPLKTYQMMISLHIKGTKEQVKVYGTTHGAISIIYIYSGHSIRQPLTISYNQLPGIFQMP